MDPSIQKNRYDIFDELFSIFKLEYKTLLKEEKKKKLVMKKRKYYYRKT